MIIEPRIKGVLDKALRVVGWILVLMTVGPIGVIGSRLVFDINLLGVTLLLPFLIFFGLGVWLVKRKTEKEHAQ